VIGNWFPTLRDYTPVPEPLKYAPPQARSVAALEIISENKRKAVPPPIGRLDDIALALRTMDYGSFMEFADDVCCRPQRLWQWANDRRVKV
jgi:hypothetical protein